MNKVEQMIENSVRKVIKEEFKKLLPFLKEIHVLSESIKYNVANQSPILVREKNKESINVDKPITELKSVVALKSLIDEDSYQKFLKEDTFVETSTSKQIENQFIKDYSGLVDKMDKISRKV